VTGALRAEWRVLGRSPAGTELLLGPLDDVAVPESPVPDTVRVGADGYDDAVQRVVDDLRPGNLVEAALYPGRAGNAGRLVEVRLRSDQRLSGGRTRRVPSVAATLWTEVADAPEPTAATQALDTPDGHAEVLVAPRGEDGAGWLAFRFGEGLEGMLQSFEHGPGRPAEVIALDVVDRPYYVAFAFERADGATARELRERVSGEDGPVTVSYEEFVEGGVSG
jgi:hypothetical protein